MPDSTLDTVQDGLIRVVADGVLVSEHQREDKAISAGYRAKVGDPDADVRIQRPDLRVEGRVVLDEAGEPTEEPVGDEPVADEPEPEPVPEGLLFSDGFSGGERTSPLWANHSDNVTVEPAPGRDGEHALRFGYNGKPIDPDGDESKHRSTAIQRFDLGGGYPEIWMRYDLRVPENYHHRDAPGPDNQKFLRVYERPDLGRGRIGGASYNPLGDGSSYLYVQWSDADHRPLSGQDRDQGSVVERPFWSHRGSWLSVGWHLRLASGPDASDGLIRLYLAGEKVAYRESIPWWWDGSGFGSGYLMGWANAGWEEDTDFWIGRVRIGSGDPGWES